MNPDFSDSTKQLAKEMAGYICSNPACLRLCTGTLDPYALGKTYIGEVAHISDARKNTARWEEDKDNQYRALIDNALFLCRNCHGLIDKNGGKNHSVALLQGWRTAHHELIREALTGNFRLAHKLKGQTAKAAQVQTLADHCAGMRALRDDPGAEVMQWVADSFLELKKLATSLHAHFSGDMRARKDLDGIVQSCNAILSALVAQGAGTPTTIALDRAQVSVLLLGRLQVGSCLQDLCNYMGIPMPTSLDHLSDAVPRKYF